MNSAGTMKDRIRALIRNSLIKAAELNLLDFPGGPPEAIEVTRSKDPKFGDYASNVAMVLAGKIRRKPRELAETIKSNIPQETGFVERLEIAGPGFINFHLAPEVWLDELREIHCRKSRYGLVDKPGAPKILLEFVSANPTGPLHVGHGRGAAVGDTLARLLRAGGYHVDTEYYLNDAGNQMKILGRSVFYRLRELVGEAIEFPENHYMGDYIKDLAGELIEAGRSDDLKDFSEEEAVSICSRFACERILAGIKDDLASFGVTYDRYYSERGLHEAGAVDKAIALLRDRG
ncbi:MAG: arginine--tRNA ligase, partial [Pseudomonadota bacterium]